MSKCVKCGNEILTGDIHWEMGLCNNCYNELYKDHKTHISLDKMWLKLAQDFRDENEKLQDKVADLETKLAESEKKAYSRGHSQRDIANEIKLNALREDVANKEKRIVELKKQLAECEKSKESYRLQNEDHHLKLLQFYSRLGVEAFGADIHEKALETLMIMKEQLAEKEKEIESYKHFKITIGTMENNQVDISSTTYTDQDKISFALEQLEQLKKLCQEKFNWWENSEWEGDIYDKSDVSNAYFDIEANIDNQINELKEGVRNE